MKGEVDGVLVGDTERNELTGRVVKVLNFTVLYFDEYDRYGLRALRLVYGVQGVSKYK